MEHRFDPTSRHDQGAPSKTPRRRRQLSVTSMSSMGGASSYASTSHEQEELDPLRSPSTSSTRRHKLATAGTSASPSHSRSQSLGGPISLLSAPETRNSSTRRREKAAVGFACLNCKKAHLACDVTRPCRRCVQIGRTSTCSDVPHKRRGRPRLRDSAQEQAESPAHVRILAASPTRSGSRGSPSVQRRGHMRTGSMNSPYMDLANPPQRKPFFGGSPRPGVPPNMQIVPAAPGIIRSPQMTVGGQLNQAWSQPPPKDVYRISSATLFVSTDLQIIRALPDAQHTFCAETSAIEGRILTELCTESSKSIMPVLIQALWADIHINKLLIRAHEHRQSLYEDLRPYTNSDLFHPFPGAQEHLFSAIFLDSYNRQIPARMVAVLGSRSNDRFAYTIVSIQRQDLPLAPGRQAMPPSPRLDTGQFVSAAGMDSRMQRAQQGMQQQQPISPTLSFPIRHMPSPGRPGPVSAVPRNIMPAFIPSDWPPGPMFSASPPQALPPALNTLAPMMNTRIPEEPENDSDPVDQVSDQASSRRSSGKRISMSLSEMIG